MLLASWLISRMIPSSSMIPVNMSVHYFDDPGDITFCCFTSLVFIYIAMVKITSRCARLKGLHVSSIPTEVRVFGRVHFHSLAVKDNQLNEIDVLRINRLIKFT